jgi:hypothetical protein
MRRDPADILDAWLSEGPSVAPDRLIATLPSRLGQTRQARGRGILRSAWLLAPVAAAATLVAVVALSSVLRPPAATDVPQEIPSPPSTRHRIDIVLLIENRSDRPFGAWYWNGYSGSQPTARSCSAIVDVVTMSTPAVLRFGEVDPDAEEPLDRESLPVLLDTNALPGSPAGYRADAVPVWTYAYRVAVDEGGTVAVEPLGSVPSVSSARPLCPEPDTSWPGGWPDVQAWLAERPTLPDCGVERVEAGPVSIVGESPLNTPARRCFFDAWVAGEGAQFTRLMFTNSGPIIEVYRTSAGAVETATQLLGPTDSDELVVDGPCTRLVAPSEVDDAMWGPEDDATFVFAIDPNSCAPAR